MLALLGTLVLPLVVFAQDTNVTASSLIIEQTADRQDFSFDRLVLLEEKLTVFDIKRIAKGWSTLRPQLSRHCGDQMTQYLQGLQDERLWALKSKCWSWLRPLRSWTTRKDRTCAGTAFCVRL